MLRASLIVVVLRITCRYGLELQLRDSTHGLERCKLDGVVGLQRNGVDDGASLGPSICEEG